MADSSLHMQFSLRYAQSSIVTHVRNIVTMLHNRCTEGAYLMDNSFNHQNKIKNSGKQCLARNVHTTEDICDTSHFKVRLMV